MKFFNRDLSWVEFNARILSEGIRKDNPLLERLRFLSIVGTNFDEFFQVRVASLKRRFFSGDEGDVSGLKPREILKRIAARCHELILEQAGETERTLRELEEAGIFRVRPENFTAFQRIFAQNFFQNEVFPLLTPIRTDGGFSNIPGGSIFAAFSLSLIHGVRHELLDSVEQKIGEKTEEKTGGKIALVRIPENLKRIVWLPSENQQTNERSLVLLEDVVLEYGTALFPGFSVEESALFSLDRDADAGVDEDSGNFVEAMEEVVASRQSSFAVRMSFSGNRGKIREFLKDSLSLDDDDIYDFSDSLPIRSGSLLELCDPSVFASSGESISSSKKLFFPPWKNFNPLKKSEKSLWQTLKGEDITLFHPYESFEPVVRLLEDAADDGKTLAIKMTLYRTEKNSAIVKSLTRAARKGKQVTVFVELKARFDEERNISWARELERAGAIVIYGIVNLKVHAKALMVVRRESDGIVRYVHLSTGNYNSRTARLYSDISLLTTNREIANDATLFFNLISGYSAIQTMARLAVAPVDLKSRLLSMIRREAESSTPENPGMIVAKMNALGHEEIIEALYEASRRGVKILLNVRGICQLVPGVPGMSESIRVVSVVGRYLEHARAVYFRNSGSEELYLSSADWMPRNLDRRVELLFPVLDKNRFSEIREALFSYFDDDTHASVLLEDGSWVPRIVGKFSVQEKLHGRFKAEYEKRQRAGTEFVVRRK